MLMETLEYMGIAFVCSVLLIIMSKIILQALIRRPADYYNARELKEEELMLNAGGISITLEHETNPEGEIMKETHLEAQLGDSDAAEPEEIMLEVPAAVAESLEVTPYEDEEEAADEAPEVAEHEITETEPETENLEAEAEVTEEPAAETVEQEAEITEEPAIEEIEDEVSEPEPEIAEPEIKITEPEYDNIEIDTDISEYEPEDEVPEEAVIETDFEITEEPAPEEAEPEITETEPETETIETKVEVTEEPVPEIFDPENIKPKAADEDFGFSIKARTSKTRKVRRIEEEEAAEELELARAAMEEARAASESAGQDAEPAPVREWSESYAEIRSSLEKAYSDNRNKPSMRMTKKQLTEIAESLGIEVPAKATKKIILSMIEEEMGVEE